MEMIDVARRRFTISTKSDRIPTRILNVWRRNTKRLCVFDEKIFANARLENSSRRFLCSLRKIENP